eukprot:3358777-Pleurochrysis_carterae.AAC.2
MERRKKDIKRRHSALRERAGCRQVLTTAQQLIELHNHSLAKLDSVNDTRSHVTIWNGLQELDCGLIVGGKRRTLGAPPSDSIDAMGTANRDLNYEA